MSYTDVFGTGTTQPSYASYLAITLTANTTLTWPFETSPGPNLLADIMDVTLSAPFSLTLPDATLGSTGFDTLITNLGSQSITVKDAGGNTIVTVAAGQAWVVYLSANTTAAGTWRSFQLGSIVTQAQAANLAGNGLVVIGALLETDVPSVSFSAAATIFAITDRAKLYRWTGGVGSCTLPQSGVVSTGWYMDLRNDGTGTLTVNAGVGDTINAAASITLQPTDSCMIVCAAAGIMCTVGLGRSTTLAFDFTTIAVAGLGVYTLSGAELNRIAYQFTGVLTGDRTIIVPATIQQYWVSNDTTGAFNLYVRTLAQIAPGVQVNQGARSILYCDSNNVLDADTAGISTPITIAQGGTSATTASGARTNLGSTSVGDAVFTALTQAAARVAIDAPSLTGAANTFTKQQTINNSASNTSEIFQCDDAGATAGPIVYMWRNSASPAAADLLGQQVWQGNSSTAVLRDLLYVRGVYDSAVNAAESASLNFQTRQAGTMASRVFIGGGLYTPGIVDGGTDTISTVSFLASGDTSYFGQGTAAAAFSFSPALYLRHKPAAPIAGTCGVIVFEQGNSAAANVQMGTIWMLSSSVAAGAETSVLRFDTRLSGVGFERFDIGQGVYTPNSAGGDKGADALNVRAHYYDGVLSSAYLWKNACINGGMEVWQRAAGGAGSVAVGASSVAYTADRWYFSTSANEASTASQQAGLTDGSAWSIRLQRNAAQIGTGAMDFAQTFDTDQIAILKNSKVMLSFVASTGANWSPGSGTLNVVLAAGTGAIRKRQSSAFTGETTPISSSVNIAAGTAAASYAFLSTIVVPTTATNLEIQFWWTPVGAAGANDWVQLDDVQVEIVPAGIIVAGSNFERRSLPVEIKMCERYYAKSFPYATAPAQSAGVTGGFNVYLGTGVTGTNGGTILLPSRMRTTPAVTTYNPSAANANVRDTTGGADRVITVGTLSDASIPFSFAAGVAATTNVVHWAADADI